MILVVVDMQKYYLDSTSSFCRYAVSRQENALTYIHNRCQKIVIPNIQKLIHYFREHCLPIIFLQLCTAQSDRKDLHTSFFEANREAEIAGFSDLYPAADQPLADIIDELRPTETDILLKKTSYSAYTSTNIAEIIVKLEHRHLVFTGLATSQCVETTARDAADRNYRVTMIEDAQADYQESSHLASLYSSSAICNQAPQTTAAFLNHYFLPE